LWVWQALDLLLGNFIGRLGELEFEFFVVSLDSSPVGLGVLGLEFSGELFGVLLGTVVGGKGSISCVKVSLFIENLLTLFLEKKE
jgi:hypothetical protein